MPHIVPSLELKGSPGPLWSMLQRLYQQLAKVVNGEISFGSGTQTDNISGFWANVTTPVSLGSFTVQHNLGRVPTGYLVVSKDTPCDVSLVSSTTSTITLIATAIANLRIFIF